MTATEIKAEIFDIITAQEQLRSQFDQLDKIKQGKLQELQQALQKQSEEVKQAKEDA